MNIIELKRYIKRYDRENKLFGGTVLFDEELTDIVSIYLNIQVWDWEHTERIHITKSDLAQLDEKQLKEIFDDILYANIQ